MSNALQPHHGTFFFSSLLFPSPAASLHPHMSSYRVWCCQAASGLFCSSVPWALTPMCILKSTHVLLFPPPHTCMHPHTHAHRHLESPLVLFLTVLGAAATFYWWLTTATSKVSLSFDSLICICSPSQHDSAYLCPQAECQCLFSAYKYPPDTVCHVYSWTFLTFDDTLDISPIK